MQGKALVFVAIVALVAASVNAVDARPKRHVLYAAAPAVAVASVPVVHAAPAAAVTSHVVHTNPTSVVKTEQVRSGDHASYSYTHEVRTEPVVHQQVHAAPVVAHTHHTVAAAVPAYYPAHYAAYYPSYAHSYAYSPYSYVVGK